MLKTIKFQAFTLCWAFIILVLCNMPTQSISSGFTFFEGFDKIAHLGLFFILTVLLFNGLILQSNNCKFRIVTFLKVGFSTVFFGGAIELLQSHIFNYRTGDWWDLFADTIGISMAIFAYLLMSNKNYFITRINKNHEIT